MLMARNRPNERMQLAQSFRFQFMSLLLLAGALPFAANGFSLGLNDDIARNSVIASLSAAIVGLLIQRRMSAYPGTGAFAYILPVYSITYGLSAIALLMGRFVYSNSMLLIGFGATLLFIFVVALFVNRRGGGRFYLVPGGTADLKHVSRRYEWVDLQEPVVPPVRHAVIVADLDWDHEPAWERMLAEAAIGGHAVYHVKQLRESLTGRLQIHHLSENSFGSLLPNHAYRGVKRVSDVLVALVTIPIVVLVMLVIGVIIRLDSPGPAIFRQTRMGYRGRKFVMYKFRTMVEREVVDHEDAKRRDAMTQADDDRITRVGKFLRRTRLDEIPQVFNVLKGEMSFIGPRPEAISLSQWYETELPFYAYRHIVRPGLTGWAQINQGHVAELEDVHRKLHYDFYYIKNFSAWLDIVIALRTVGIVLLGHGWR